MTTPTTVNVRLQLRADTAANWTAANPILLANEVGLETDTKKLKVGNGSTAWNSLAYFPSIVSGGTVLGNLEIGSTGTLTFEGSTADGFETTLAVTNPTADRTITLPNQSGTVVVSGNASIVDADIAANAEIAVSKLADGAARQLLQTDAAGTGVEWTSNVDIPGTLDVTGTATFDGAVTVAGDLTVNGTTTTISTQNLLVEDKNIIIGDVATPTDVTADGGGITLKGATDKTINWVDSTDAWTSSERFSVPLGSAASPSLTFTGDPNTGIYSPGADQVAISTGGSGRLFVDASGNVGIGTALPSAALDVSVGFIDNNRFDAPGVVRLNRAQGTASSPTAITSPVLCGAVQGRGYDGTTHRTVSSITFEAEGAVTSTSSPGYVALNTTPSGATIASERLRITSAGLVGVGTSSPGGRLDVQGGDVYLGKTAQGDIFFSDGNDTYVKGASNIFLQTPNGSNRITVKGNTGNVGIGTTSPSYAFDVNGQARVAGDFHLSGGSVFDALSQDVFIQGNSGYGIIFRTNGANERARIDSSGRLLVGTSSALTAADVSKSKLVVNGDTDGSGYPGRIALNNSVATVLANYKLGEVYFSGQAAGNAAASIACYAESDWNTAGDTTDNPGYLVFSTTRDGQSSPSEACRIDSSQRLLVGRIGPDGSALIQAPATSSIPGYCSATGVATAVTHFEFRNSNGLVGTISTNASATAYNTSSDYRLKENVAPVTDGITRLQRLKPSRFSFIADPTKTVDGFLAHEAAEVVPECVTGDKDAVDDEGNPVYQGIDQSKLVPLLTAALQEAIGEIESLKARVAALESA